MLRLEGEYSLPADLTGWTLIEEGVPCDRLNLAQSHYLDGPCTITRAAPGIGGTGATFKMLIIQKSNLLEPQWNRHQPWPTWPPKTPS